MNKNNLVEYVDYLLQIAMSKVQNICDAEDLVQETLMAALHAINQGKTINNPKSWLVTVLNHKFYDMLRQKYRNPLILLDVFPDIPTEDNSFDKLNQSEIEENIRHCLAYLTKIYREVMVRFYMHGESVKQIANSLNIPENTVKSRLNIGRKLIRKEYIMDNYAKQSYEPDVLWLSSSGQQGMNGEPNSIVQSDKIKMNLLILAYDQPVTVPELAKAIGISTTYLEPIVDELVRGELMKRVSDKVYTDFIIYTEKDRTANLEIEEELSNKLYKDIWIIIEKGLKELREQEFYKTQRTSQQLKLESYFAIKTLQSAVINIRDEVTGGILPYEQYPNRPNGGKWFAMGSRYPTNYDWKVNTYQDYYISGDASVGLEDYCGVKRIFLCEYDCKLGRTHRGYLSIMSNVDVLKMMYAIYSGREDNLAIINMNCFKNISQFENLKYLRKDENGKIVVDIPIISMKDRQTMIKISEKSSQMIKDRFSDEIAKLMKNPVILPTHLKSVPTWQRYMVSSSTFTMRVILNAKRDGLFLNGYDIPIPAAFLVIEK